MSLSFLIPIIIAIVMVIAIAAYAEHMRCKNFNLKREHNIAFEKQRKYWLGECDRFSLALSNERIANSDLKIALFGERKAHEACKDRAWHYYTNCCKLLAEKIQLQDKVEQLEEDKNLLIDALVAEAQSHADTNEEADRYAEALGEAQHKADHNHNVMLAWKKAAVAGERNDRLLKDALSVIRGERDDAIDALSRYQASSYLDTERLNFIDVQQFTRWAGYSTANCQYTWPVFAGESYRQAIDRAMQSKREIEQRNT